MKSAASSQSPRTITAHDTLERLSYTKRPPFNALWVPRDIVGINVKAAERRRILGDKYLESTIKERPRRYMVPSVSLDDVQDKDKRKLMIDFIYKTTVNQAAREVWGDFKAQRSCLLKRHVEEQEKPLTGQQVISRMSTRYQGAARKWDSMQSRSFPADDSCYDKKDKTRKETATCIKETHSEAHAGEEISEKKRTIRKLIDEDKSNIVYDKLPSSYTGCRPYIACGVSKEKRRVY